MQTAMEHLLHKMYPRLEEVDIEAIMDYDPEVDTCMRSMSLPLDVKVQLRLEAYIRHNMTYYDDLLADGIDRDRARMKVASQVSAVVRYFEGETNFSKRDLHRLRNAGLTYR